MFRDKEVLADGVLINGKVLVYHVSRDREVALYERVFKNDG